MNNVLTNDNTTMNNSGEICIRKPAAFYNSQNNRRKKNVFFTFFVRHVLAFLMFFKFLERFLF